jgi:hypothetical protein
MFQPRKDVRIAGSPEFNEAELRRWREPSERVGRDNRPGFYSVTGAFVRLPDQTEATLDDKTT